MRRDSLFFKLFQQFPGLLFDLLETRPENAEAYRFDSVAVKEPSFTIDGVFLPPASEPPGVVYACEVQFQKDPQLYERLFAEVMVYFYRNRARFRDWQAVVIYPSRNMEQSETLPYEDLLNGRRMHRIYLNELGAIEQLPLGVAVMVLTTLSDEAAPPAARALLSRAAQETIGGTAAPEVAAAKRRVMMEMISTVMIYKFTQLSRQEVEAMLDLRLEETRVYQEAKEEGRQEGRQEGEQIGEQKGEQIGRRREAVNLLVRILSRRLGGADVESLRDRLLPLGVETLEQLGEALLDFTTIEDLEDWLRSHREQQQIRMERVRPALMQQLGEELSEAMNTQLQLLSVEQLEVLEEALKAFSGQADLEQWLQTQTF